MTERAMRISRSRRVCLSCSRSLPRAASRCPWCIASVVVPAVFTRCLPIGRVRTVTRPVVRVGHRCSCDPEQRRAGRRDLPPRRGPDRGFASGIAMATLSIPMSRPNCAASSGERPHEGRAHPPGRDHRSGSCVGDAAAAGCIRGPRPRFGRSATCCAVADAGYERSRARPARSLTPPAKQWTSGPAPAIADACRGARLDAG